MKVLDEHVSAVIGQLYTATGDEGAWRAAVEDVIAVTEARWALVSVTDLRHRNFTRSGFFGGAGDTRFAIGVDEFNADPFHIDPTLVWASRNPRAGFVDSRQAVGGDYGSDPHVRWNKARFGNTHWLVGYTPPRDELIFGFSLHPHEGPLSDRQERLFRMLYAHAENAVQLHARAPWAVESAEACLLLGRDGGVRWVSSAAEALLASGDGLAIAQNMLTARDSASQRQLYAAVRSALLAKQQGGVGGAAAFPRPSGKRDLIALISPVLRPPSFFEALGPAVLVRLVDPEANGGEAGPSLWMKLFGFTKAEARLAAALLTSEDGLKGAAEALGIAYATARVHLLRLFDKASVNSQAQLLRLLTRVSG